jgi:hypothetical protein
MKPNVYSRRKEAWEERKRQMLAAGLVSDRFPEVSSIVVTIDYSRGSFSAVHRTMNFYPGSQAFFKISSLGEESDAGGLDLTRFIHKMIGSHAKSAKGAYNGGRKDPDLVHQNVDYEVAITYS